MLPSQYMHIHACQHQDIHVQNASHLISPLVGTPLALDRVFAAPFFVGFCVVSPCLFVQQISGQDSNSSQGMWTTQIAVDFSSVGGPATLIGTWDPLSEFIQWADGNHWKRLPRTNGTNKTSTTTTTTIWTSTALPRNPVTHLVDVSARADGKDGSTTGSDFDNSGNWNTGTVDSFGPDNPAFLPVVIVAVILVLVVVGVAVVVGRFRRTKKGAWSTG